MPIKIISAVETSKRIKAELKAVFPRQKFSVCVKRGLAEKPIIVVQWERVLDEDLSLAFRVSEITLPYGFCDLYPSEVVRHDKNGSPFSYEHTAILAFEKWRVAEVEAWNPEETE